MTTCEICGDRLAKSIEGYKNHYKRFHLVNNQVKQVSIIRPIRTTNRTKMQIVHDMEKVWAQAIFPIVKPWHSVEDR